MKELSLPTKLYLYAIFMAGMGIFAWHLNKMDFSNLWMLIILCFIASLTLILKVAGTTNRSHYTFSFLVYGFTFALYGTPEAILVIAVSNLVEWLWNRPAWFIQLFNTACYILLMQAAGLVYHLINPDHVLVSWQAVAAIAASMATFNVLNHLAVGIVLWLARGENFKTSGIFDFFPITLDLALLYFGASLSFVWTYNYFALALFLIPLYLIYSTLRVPALERQSETDSKTGLFNHRYFKQQFENEFNRANRFDRPLAMIMADLDLLRNINNTYGHLAGDEVLIGVANVLKQSVRDYDIVARFGGEEFAILMPETTIQAAHERAETIRKAIEKTEFVVPTSMTPIRITMSFGIACRESSDQTTDEITHNADAALYHSKLSGRNQAFAYSKESYVTFGRPEELQHLPQLADGETPHAHPEPVSKPSSHSKPASPDQPPEEKPGSTPEIEGSASSTKSRTSDVPVNLYIGAVTALALLSSAGMYFITTPMQYFQSSSAWFGLFVISALIAMAEWFSVDLYFRETAISTSAIPILVGYLFFGPLGIFAVSLVLAVSLVIKHRSHISRVLFNFSNHLLAGTLCIALIAVMGRQYSEWGPFIQLILSLAAAVLVYLITTWSIAIGMGLDLERSARQIWKEQFSWLAPYYIGFGILAYLLGLGYKQAGSTGLLAMIVPMALLRWSQKQYIDRTKDAVIELREKNQILNRRSEEIIELNESLLEILSEIIDFRDPQVLGHSKQVSHYATQIAKILKLDERQVEFIRKGALLHDIGKLGIPGEILSKPSRLTADEYEIVQRHPVIGAELIDKSPSLRSLMPIVRHHHEFFNGKGYPDKLMSSQIPIEARIVSLADAIEAMSSDRPYRRALTLPTVVNEIRAHTGTQFDPVVADAAIQMLEAESQLAAPEAEIQPGLVRTFVPSA
jgi:diguanylate cyclase (GGDEF)-like protein/putative nucleotidyltransferase with HDIG domain